MSGSVTRPAPTHPPGARPRRVTGRRLLTEKQVRRAVYSLSLVAAVLVLGTLGFEAIAGLGLVDAVYFESMLATGQGPPLALTSDAAKLFASLMAFVSVGSVLTSVVFTLGPIVARLWHEAVERAEREIREVERELEGRDPPA